jgi:DNA-binding response OmpR family regulator
MAIILIVEDDPDTQEILRMIVRGEGHTPRVAGDGVEALTMLRAETPDLVILDLMLPLLDGLEVCRRAREFTYVPILMLTAKDTEVDKIVGLEVGADDYIAKPFDPGEVRARLRAHLRRATLWQKPPAAQPLARGPLRLDPARFEATLQGEVLNLTRIEFDLLHCLAAHPGIVFSRERLMEQVWGAGEYIVLRGIDVHVSRLRNKIEPDPAHPRFILTVHGVGYKFAG